MSQSNWHRHEFFSFVSCVTEHHTLVTGTDFIEFISATFTSFQCVVNAHSNIGGLFVDSYINTASIAVKTVFGTSVPDFTNSFTNNMINIYITVSGNFTHYMNLTCGYKCFTRNMRRRILCNNRIKHGVWNLVSNFIRMTFRYGFRCEKYMFFSHLPFTSIKKFLISQATRNQTPSFGIYRRT